MGKVIVVNVHFLDGVTCVTDSHFFHKDSGCQLVISGLNLETGTQVHFSLTEKSGKPVSMIGVSDNGILSVDVPDNVLNSNTKRNDYDIYAFVYCTDENSGWTEHEIVIPVRMRPDKEFENPTSEELTAFDKIAQYVSETAESIADDREQINKNKEDIEYLKEHGTSGGNIEDYKLPQATETNLGGVKASPKTDNDTVEARIGADGKLYVPAYPEQNEIPVDSALDKTSTNPVQNKVVAEAVEKLSNDKLEKKALPDAINTALTQAKESGAFDGTNGTTPHIGENGNWFIGDEDTGVKAEGKDGYTPQKGKDYFDGADGKNGSDGQDGEDGADGITPHIGENGNWFIGDEDTGVSAAGETTSITVDDKLNKESTNPIQNKAVAEAVEKLSNDKLNANALPDAINTALTQAKESGAFDGTNGTTPHIGANGNWFIGESDTGNPSRGEKGDTGEQGPQGIQGEKGATGADGKTPEKGVDYFTEADKTAFVEDVLNALPTWEGGAY